MTNFLKHSFQLFFNLINKSFLYIFTGVCFLLLFFSLILTTNSINASAATSTSSGGASIASLSLLGIDCLFPGAPNIKKPGTKCGPTDRTLLNILIDLLTVGSYPLGVLVIMWGGYQYFMGGIDGKSSGVKAIQYAVMGMFIILFAQTISNAFSSSDESLRLLNNKGEVNPQAILKLTNAIRGLLVSLSGAVAILVIIWGGYKYFFSGMDWEKDGGLKTIRNGIFGLVVVLLANTVYDEAEKFALAFSKKNADTGDTLLTLQQTFINPLLESTTSILFNLATASAILVIVYGGYKYYFNAVEASKEDGLKAIRGGVVGLITIFFANVVVNLIKQVIPTSTQSGKGLEIKTGPITDFMRFLLGDIILPTSTALAVFFIVWAGYNWITANGDEKKVQAAQKGVNNAVIGLVVMLLSATLVQLIVIIFNNGNLGSIGG
jgi:Type IV secretion system pilin